MKRVRVATALLLLLALMIPSASVFAGSPPTALASPSVRQIPPLPQDNGTVETKGLKTKIIREALQLIARKLRTHLDDVIRAIEPYVSKTVRDAIRRYAGRLADFLDTIARYEELTLNFVQHQISGFLISIGCPAPTARTIGWIIRMIIEWGLL